MPTGLADATKVVIPGLKCVRPGVATGKCMSGGDDVEIRCGHVVGQILLIEGSAAMPT